MGGWVFGWVGSYVVECCRVCSVPGLFSTYYLCPPVQYSSTMLLTYSTYYCIAVLLEHVMCGWVDALVGGLVRG